MFPNSYTFNPGVVLDPVTMTPMVTNGGNVTVNPLGVPMRPEQKVWQKMFIKNIPYYCPNEIMVRLLNYFGAVKNFKRAVDNRGRLLTFCHFDIETGEEILRIKRLFNNIRILDKNLYIKISPYTDNFIKYWMTIQKDEWRKKLLSANMNEAKEYDTIYAYQMRDDTKYRQRIDDTLRQINVEVKKLAIEKMREDYRKEHPREKEREKAKRKLNEDLERNFHQKEEYWLKRERYREREYRKEKEAERYREKAKARRLYKEIALSDEYYYKRVTKFIIAERRKQVEKEYSEDLYILLHYNPPLPYYAVEQVRKVRGFMDYEVKLGYQKIEGLLVYAPRRLLTYKYNEKVQQLKRHELFDGWEREFELETEKPQVYLNLPYIVHYEVDKEYYARWNRKLLYIAKQVPQNKEYLWSFPINWEKLSKSVVLYRNIRPWLYKSSEYYMGSIEYKFIALVYKKLLSQTHPDKIIFVLRNLLDDDTEEFVVKLWKTLVFEYLKLYNELI